MVADAIGAPPEGVLFPQEQQLVAQAVDKRVRDFTAGRTCARHALSMLGLSPRALLCGSAREPLWPDGVIGSLTHCEGYWAAAVAPRIRLRGLGIDAEPHERLPGGVAGQVLSSLERRRIGALPEGVCWDRLLFSAKESVYKAWYPQTGRWLGFEDAVVEPRPHQADDPTTGGFVARLLVPPAQYAGCLPSVFSGRYAVRRGLVLTVVAVP